MEVVMRHIYREATGTFDVSKDMKLMVLNKRHSTESSEDWQNEVKQALEQAIKVIESSLKE